MITHFSSITRRVIGLRFLTDCWIWRVCCEFVRMILIFPFRGRKTCVELLAVYIYVSRLSPETPNAEPNIVKPLHYYSPSCSFIIQPLLDKRCSPTPQDRKIAKNKNSGPERGHSVPAKSAKSAIAAGVLVRYILYNHEKLPQSKAKILHPKALCGL